MTQTPQPLSREKYTRPVPGGRGLWWTDRLWALAADLPIERVKLADIADNTDEARLAMLDEVTAARLRQKYAKARVLLGCPVQNPV